MKSKTYLICCGVVAVASGLSMLFVPPLAQGFESLVLLFLSIFATG
ncbi:MAG: hypothetical protein OXE78_07660 [Gammaproteobacteria bacterium]|nr:hypothetical protein [Gammaproteobacteria bacterium]MCY4358884.1 hypothetical protein [Gammaproteobacteria bacterium]